MKNVSELVCHEPIPKMYRIRQHFDDTCIPDGELPQRLRAELEKLAAEAPVPEPTPEERIAALEQDNAELREALEALISGVTE